MLQRPATVNATADHMETLDAGAQQGLVGECGPERVQVMESGEETFERPAGLFKKKIPIPKDEMRPPWSQNCSRTSVLPNAMFTCPKNAAKT